MGYKWCLRKYWTQLLGKTWVSLEHIRSTLSSFAYGNFVNNGMSLCRSWLKCEGLGGNVGKSGVYGRITGKMEPLVIRAARCTAHQAHRSPCRVSATVLPARTGPAVRHRHRQPRTREGRAARLGAVRRATTAGVASAAWRTR